VFPKPGFGADRLAILVDSGGKGSSSIGRRASLPQQFDAAAVRNFKLGLYPVPQRSAGLAERFRRFRPGRGDIRHQ
jgi:hypothetical protein